VSYLNTIPFIYGIEHEGNLRAELLLSPPSLCAKNFAEHKADIALVPAAAVPSLADAQVVTEYCIGAAGPLRTVGLLRNAAKETAARLFSLLDGRDHSAGQRTACVFIIVKASCKGGKHLFPFAASVYHNRCERAVKVPEGAQKSCKAKIKALLRPYSGQFQYKTRRLCVPLRVFRYC